MTRPSPSGTPGAATDRAVKAARALPTADQILRAPKVLLHDHLDGGLRPATVAELARRA
ncbi:adenosine deaminase, partial [Streptomyces sp. SID11233]|nr:adenosine deaminase [Streptomyces sp. SID11233]